MKPGATMRLSGAVAWTGFGGAPALTRVELLTEAPQGPPPISASEVDFLHSLSLKPVTFQPLAAFLLAFQAGLVERIGEPFLSPLGLLFHESTERIRPPGPPEFTASTAMTFFPFTRLFAISARTGVDHSFEETAFLPLM